MASQEWYTPPEIVEMVVSCLGIIDLDPCANPQEIKNIPARQHFDAAVNGLDKPWKGRVFLNPPFAGTGQWVAKLQEQYWAGNVTEAILLCLASTETRWFQWLAAQPLCLPNQRINYMYETPLRLLVKKKGFDRPSCLFYFGPNQDRFAEVFGQPFGRIYRCDERHQSPDNIKG